jgi:hypothetical protein
MVQARVGVDPPRARNNADADSDEKWQEISYGIPDEPIAGVAPQTRHEHRGKRRYQDGQPPLRGALAQRPSGHDEPDERKQRDRGPEREHPHLGYAEPLERKEEDSVYEGVE